MAQSRLIYDPLEDSPDDFGRIPVHEAQRRLQAVWDIVDLYWPTAPAPTKRLLHDIESAIRPDIALLTALKDLPH